MHSHLCQLFLAFALALPRGMSYHHALRQLATAMSNLNTTPNFLPEPALTASVKSCLHSSDLERRYGSGFALSARCFR
jgi:hypothetical protein